MISSFRLVKDPENESREMLIHGGSGLSVQIFRAGEEEFKPSAGQYQFYGYDAEGKLLAFQSTSGFTGEGPVVVIEAMRWYSQYVLNYPEMEILMRDPRPDTEL